MYDCTLCMYVERYCVLLQLFYDWKNPLLMSAFVPAVSYVFPSLHLEKAFVINFKPGYG